MELTWTSTDQKAVDTARVLAADAVQKVGNGHPGTAISLAPVAYLLFNKIMRHCPEDPRWHGRDKFVLSIGHSSLTLYNQLFLTGYGVELDDLKSLRTWGALTPGHPEFGHTPGVEMTTGPLGQGVSSAVGMAMAARRERGLFDPDAPEGTSPFDHFVYAIVGEGCLEEGISSEASSLAGTQKLGKLIVLWDDNRISIEGDTNIAFNEDVLARYRAYGWHTQHVDFTSGGTYHEDVQGLADAIEAAQKVTDKPSIIRVSTIIAWPCPTKQGEESAHGSALGAEEIAGLKRVLGMDPEKNFDVDSEVLTYTRTHAHTRGENARREWEGKMAQWRENEPERAALYDRLCAGKLPEDWKEALPSYEVGTALATRAASGQVLTALAPVLPELWGGSADLAGSNNTTMKGEPSFLPEDRQSNVWQGNPYGRTIHFGIREHAMAAIVNGINLGGLTRAYCGTFFVFADYMRGAVRLAALMKTPSIFVWSHDSIGVGEDGPTHQPIEHLWAYRAIPQLAVVRPADANETAYAWAAMIEDHREGPAGIVLTRQNVPVLEGTSAEGVSRGGYVLADSPTGSVDVQLLATGSEVQLAVEAQQTLAAQGVGARVISLPCVEWFEAQPQEYRDSVILPDVKARVSVEAGLTFGWRQYVGDAGRSIGIDHYGASAAGTLLFKEYGVTSEAVAHAALESITEAK